MMRVLDVMTRERCQMMNVTGEVSQAVKTSGVEKGVCLLFVPHTTAGIVINENADPDVTRDILSGLDAMVPRLKYRHMEGNSDAHIKAALAGQSLTLIIEDGDIQLGTWQGIYFCEFDGPRERKLFVRTIKAEE